MSRDLIAIPALEKSFLYSCGGKKGLVIGIDVSLDEAVDRNRLTAAVRKALAAKPHFRSVPAVSDHRFYYRIREGEPDILEGVNRTVSLGREESRGFLFLVCMEDRRISFRVHHALADARGWIDFVRTALAFYYGEDADPALDGGLVPFVEKHIDESRPFGKYKTGKYPVFTPPEERFPVEENRCRAFLLTLPLSGLMKEVKRTESSPAVLFSALISEAFCRVYETGDRVVVANTAVDARRFFGERAENNASLGAWIPYHPRLRKMKPDLRPSLLRARLMLEIQEENLVEEMRDVASLSDMVENALSSVSLSGLLELTGKAQENNNRERRFPLTYQLAYAGHVSFTPVAEEHVQKLVFSYPAYENQSNFDIVEHGGVITVSYMQNFEGNGMISEFARMLQELVPETVLEDLGERSIDSFDLSDYLKTKEVPSKIVR